MAASDDLHALETLADDTDRDDLALKLAEAGTPGLDAVLERLIRRPDLADKRARLVHALGQLDCSEHLPLLAELVATGDAEVAHEALQALETVEEADGEQVEAAVAVLDRARGAANLEIWRIALLEEAADMFE
ncbi:hypothetical protein [Caulobacter sp.]|jgi:hypothetical protein|uniref:hypothetical protein n=1 Tax=Caulobacter sp. TaxID=78 RepID=UPI001621F886